jgi:ribonuclease BN (tRNA processing enzyme)
MRLHLIGSGCPTPVPRQFGSAFGLELDDALILIDCGPAATYKMVRMGISPLRIDHVFLTHHHFDHTADVACLALTRWDLCTGGEPPLSVYGPRPTQRFIDMLLRRGGAYAPDWQSRIQHPASIACHEERGGLAPRPAPKIEAADLTAGDELGTGSWHMRCANVKHVAPGLVSLAYRFDTPGHSIVFAGDCADCPELRSLAAEADTLVVACAHLGPARTRPEIAAVITGAPEIGAPAAETAVQRVVLTHVSPGFDRPGVRERAIAEIAARYTGEILFPDELQSVDLDR